MNPEDVNKKLSNMSEQEEAEWLYQNREALAREARPVTLDKIVSVRFSEDELQAVATAASAAGMTISAFIRKATTGALVQTNPEWTAVGPAEVSRIKDSLLSLMAHTGHLGELIEKLGEKR